MNGRTDGWTDRRGSQNSYLDSIKTIFFWISFLSNKLQNLSFGTLETRIQMEKACQSYLNFQELKLYNLITSQRFVNFRCKIKLEWKA